MSTWRDMASENLRAAKSLLDLGYHRACVNRAYYCAYASATASLLSSGQSPSSALRPNPGHEQIASMVRHNLDRQRYNESARRDLSARIRMLRRFRVVADYEPRETLPRDIAVQCVRNAAEVHEALSR